MAKCPVCRGKGYRLRIDDMRFAMAEIVKCESCDGKGVVEPLSEQEYIQTCNTEQLADLMSRMVGCSNCPIPKDGRSCMGTYSGCWHEIIKWLKQPHKGD